MDKHDKHHHGKSHHAHKISPEHMAILMAPERKESLDPEKVFSHLPLKETQSIADIGCGPGYFTIPLAKRLSKGKVYAFDTEEAMLAEARKNAAAATVENVEFAKTSEMEIPAIANAFDGAFIALVLHEIEGSLPAYVSMVKGKLKTGGWVAILDWKKEQTSDGPPLKARFSEAEVRTIGEEGGLRYVRQATLNSQQFLVLFTKG